MCDKILCVPKKYTAEYFIIKSTNNGVKITKISIISICTIMQVIIDFSSNNFFFSYRSDSKLVK